MDKQFLVNQLDLLLREHLSAQGLILVDLVLRYEGGRLILRILADRPSGGISMDECAMLNRDIGAILDEKMVIEDRYTLEVSSPGLDRTLNKKDDFLRILNKEAKFFLNEALNGKIEWDGFIESADEEEVLVKTKEGIIKIPYLKINKSRLII